MASLRFIYELFLPAVLLIAAYFALPNIHQLTASFKELVHYIPYALLFFGMVLGLKFNRGRIFYLLPILGIAVWSYDYYLIDGQHGFTERVIRYSLYLLLPLNAVIFFLFRERGIFGIQGVVRLLFIAIQLAAIGWVIETKQAWLLELVTKELVHTPYLATIILPQLAFVVLVSGLVVLLLGIFLVRRSPIDIGILGAYIGIASATLFVGDADAFRLYIAVAVLILIISVIQDSHRMAYRDELTGLLGRRALNEYMMGLGRRYTIAMLDVDHFKKFNDTYGHDVGDQVLKMVGSQMKEITGGGKSFRYGGEEFAVIFPRRHIEKCIPHLEALRGSIAAYQLQLRSKDRPKRRKDGKKLRSSKRGCKTVSVTISIGVAERVAELKSPENVIKQADKALYRAKRRGRNCLCQ